MMSAPIAQRAEGKEIHDSGSCYLNLIYLLVYGFSQSEGDPKSYFKGKSVLQDDMPASTSVNVYPERDNSRLQRIQPATEEARCLIKRSEATITQVKVKNNPSSSACRSIKVQYSLCRVES